MELKKQSTYSGYLAIFGSLAYVIMMVGAIMLIPLLLLFFYPEEIDELPCFAFPGVLSIFAGYLIKLFTPDHSIRNLKRHQGSVVVLLIWFVSIFLGAFPFFLTKDYTFTEALFESTSGFTTTGFSVTDVENASHMILFYRSLLHLFGGVGLVLILSSVLSNIYGMQLFNAEGHRDRLTPSILHSARTIVYIYLGFIIGGTILFTSFGMSLFDAINHSISAVATGGFSTKADSIGYWSVERVGLVNSVGIDITAIVLMLLGSINFMASLALLRGKFKNFFSHSETKVTLFFIAIVTPIMVVDLLQAKICTTTLSAIDNAVFHTVSMITTTGLSTVQDYHIETTFAIVPILVMMIVGGHSGSTAGGVKASRAALVAKSLIYDVREQVLPKRVYEARYINRFGKQVPITHEEQSENYTYIMIYTIIGFLGSFGLTLCGYPLGDAIFDFFSALGTIGLSMGGICKGMNTFAMWLIMAGMIIARLEIYIVIFAFARIFKDIKETIIKVKNKLTRRKSR